MLPAIRSGQRTIYESCRISTIVCCDAAEGLWGETKYPGTTNKNRGLGVPCRDGDRCSAGDPEPLCRAALGARDLDHTERIDQSDVVARPHVRIRPAQHDRLAADEDHRVRSLRQQAA